MSNQERTGKRDLAYSQWHRPKNLAAELEPVFAHIEDWRERRRAAYMAADACTMIDIDGLEYCKRCLEPLALIETKHVKATTKSTAVMQRLAELSLVPAYLVEYDTGDDGTPTRFVVTRRYPAGERQQMTPTEYAAFVLGIHQGTHECLNAAAA